MNRENVIIEMRKDFAQIIANVLSGQISAAEALKQWPIDKQGKDISIDSAYHALIHFRDDVDVHEKDIAYKNLQLSELREIYNYLVEGKEIPKKIKSFYIPRTFASIFRNILSLIGVATILGLVLNITSVQNWLASPKLDVEVLDWSGIRETSSFSGGVPVFDEFEVKLNIIPRVRFHPGYFPINQVKGLSVRKGQWFGAYKADKEIPFVIRDEPVTLTLVLHRIPIEGPSSNNVEIKIIDLWGHISTVSIKNSF